MGRVARIKRQFSHPEQLTEGELREWQATNVVFSLGEAEYDHFLIEHASQELQ